MSAHSETEQSRDMLPNSGNKTQQIRNKSNQNKKPTNPKSPTGEQSALYQTIMNPLEAGPNNILRLHSVLGNQVVNGIIQAKLTVGAAGDRYEIEADRLAEQVVSPSRWPQPPSLQVTNMVSPGIAPANSSLANAGDGDLAAAAAVEKQLMASKISGQPLPDQARHFMEQQFGTDLSQVRIHTGSQAEHINHELQAEALTHGRDIYLGRGNYAPHTKAGQHLLAHEITHVIQQGSTTGAQAAPALQRWDWPWSKKKEEKKPAAPAAKGKSPSAIPEGLDATNYTAYMMSHPGLFNEKERAALGIKMKTMHATDEQMQKFDQRQQVEQRRELNAIGGGIGAQSLHSHDEAGDVASMVEDPRFESRYKVDRESDHGNWFARKFKRGKEVASDKLKEVKSYLPGQHSVIQGEDFAQQYETTGDKAKRIAKTAAVKGGKKLLSSIPLVGTGMNIAAAVKEGDRQHLAEEVSDTAVQSPQQGTMRTPFLHSMAEGLATDHYNKKVNRAFDATIGAVDDAVTITGAVLSGGASLGVTESANMMFKEAVKPVISAGIKGAKAGVKLGNMIAGATMDDRQYRLEASGAKTDQSKGGAVGKLAAEDPEFAQAMLKHLAPGQMSVGHELYTNTRIQEPQGDHTLKPSQVAKLGRQEQARLRERDRMGAAPTWSLEGEQQQAKARKQSTSEQRAISSPIPTPPPLPKRAPQPLGPKKENLLGKLLKSEEEAWYET